MIDPELIGVWERLLTGIKPGWLLRTRPFLYIMTMKIESVASAAKEYFMTRESSKFREML